jgi:hypothetical protein
VFSDSFHEVSETWKDLQMCKKYLRGVKEMPSAHVLEARRMANELVAWETKGNGDTENAMRRVEAKYGVPFGFQWSLRYRPPGDVLMGLFLRLQAAYQQKLNDQLKRLEHERSITEAKGWFAQNLVAAADALDCEKGK